MSIILFIVMMFQVQGLTFKGPFIAIWDSEIFGSLDIGLLEGYYPHFYDLFGEGNK